MSSDGSITHWLTRLQAGEPTAIQRLWERYFHRLVGLARARLHGRPRRAADEEDVALSAFDSFCRAAAQGRFPQLADRDNLWQLLVVITTRKALRLVRQEGRQKRGGGAVLDEAALRETGVSPLAMTDFEEFLSLDPTPEFAAEMTEECQRLLARLPEATLRAVALAKMEGYTNEEIAARLGCGLRTIERKLGLIRGIWEKELNG